MKGMSFYSLFKAEYWNRNCDPRSIDTWLMRDGPWKLILISIVYLLAILIGTKMMHHRKAFEIRVPMFVYNVSMVIINIFFFWKSFWWTNYGRDLLNFRFPSSDDRSPRALKIVDIYFCYQITKFVDYFDTFFFILRKKNNQITALHVYHHVSVPIVGWISNWICPTMPVLGLFVMLNSLCHTLMYLYYALTALGTEIRAVPLLKPYITQVQLIQFVIIEAYGLTLCAFHTNYPFIYRMMPVSQAFIYLVMFGNFYQKSYCKSRHLHVNNNEKALLINDKIE